MRAVDILRKKRDGGELSRGELAAFVDAAARGRWPDYQLSAFLMAAFLRGLNPDETAVLTELMAHSGEVLDLSDMPGPKVDKHSTGGVGDKTSLILGPLAAACGVVVPMMSGRGLGHTGGTLDKLEAIPGFRVGLGIDEFKAALRTVGIGMIGQTDTVAPADKALYALRDVTATVESVPLITASILSKKIAEGISGLVLDVKAGRGAFMKTVESARELAESLVRVGTLNGLRCEAVLTRMDAPLGRAVGNANEVAECVAVLKGEGPADLTDLSVELAARMVRLAGLADVAGATAKVRQALISGAGLEIFRRMVEQQGGDPRVADDPSAVLPAAPHSTTVTADRRGIIEQIDAEAVGVAAMLLGAGRRTAADRVDPAVGVTVKVPVGGEVSPGDAVFAVAYRDESSLAEALPRLAGAYTLTDRPVRPAGLVLDTVA